jgi:hypothetical protein
MAGLNSKKDGNCMTDRYINIFTDFGFKKVFGEEVNKDLLYRFPQ